MKQPVPAQTDQRKLTLKQRKWLKVYLETGNATEAAKQAYDVSTDDSAWALGSENLSKLKVTIEEMMERKGLSTPKLLNVLDEGLEAWKIHTSHTEPDKTIPDFQTRAKYLDTAFKLKRLLVPENMTQINNELKIVIQRDNE
jgi:phage terminase small subunit